MCELIRNKFKLEHDEKNKLNNKEQMNTKGKYTMSTRKLFTICGIAVALAAGAVRVSAQTNAANGLAGVVGSGGQADPAQQRYMQRVHDGLGLRTTPIGARFNRWCKMCSRLNGIWHRVAA